MHPSSTMMISTLGTEAQVITAALDLLIKQGEKINELEVLHSTAPGTLIEAAVKQLATVRQTRFYPDLTLTLIPFKNQQGDALPDIETPADGQDGFRGLYQRVRLAKQAGKRVHLLVAGGRKLLSIYGIGHSPDFIR